MEDPQPPQSSQFLSLVAPVTDNPTSIYTPLDKTGNEIRLLEILPAKSGDPEASVECKLFTCSLNDKPSYTALSYVWGDPNDTKPIIVNCKEVQITINLKDALCQLQKDSVRTLWADALCIDQANDDEKAQQVKKMTEIYRHATTVAAWLGTEDQSTGRTMRTIRKLSQTFALLPVQSTKILSLEIIKSRNARTTLASHGRHALEILSKDPTFAKGDLGAVWAYCERPYWKRLWTIQEISVANKAILCCGSHAVRWEDLQAAAALLAVLATYHIAPDQRKLVQTHRDLIHPYDPLRCYFPRALVLNSALQNAQMDGLSLIDALSFTCDDTDLVASDPRDRIYALHGMLAKQERDAISIDYTISHLELFKQVSTQMLADYGPQTLTFAGLERRSTSCQLPSWVIDWTCTRSLGGGFTVFGTVIRVIPNGYQFQALDKARMALQASVVDRVSEVATYSGDAETMPEIISQLCEWSLPKQRTRRRATAANPAISMYYTLLRGRSFGSRSMEDVDRLFENYVRSQVACGHQLYDDQPRKSSRSGLRRLRPLRSEISKLWSVVQGKVYLDFEKLIKGNISGESKFFVTREGCIGSCEVAVQAGDVLYAFPEHWSPFILRPHSDEGQGVEWELVGPEFVGELNDVNENGDPHLDDFWDTKPAMEEIILR